MAVNTEGQNLCTIEKGISQTYCISLLTINSLNVWILDSVVNRHMTGDVTLPYDYYHSNYSTQIRVANRTYAATKGYRTAYITDDLVLEYVLYVPNCACDLISISTLVNPNSFLVIVGFGIASIR